jgi:ribosomal protein S18 acetylase RimI-like enzyme
VSQDLVMLRLRPFVEADDAELLTWFPTPSDLRRFAGASAAWPLSVRQLACWRSDPRIRAWSAVGPSGGERLLGHVQIVQTGPGTARLARVAIAPSDRRGGLGAALVTAALEQARALHLDALDLHVYDDNEPAVRLYASLGFTARGPHPDHPGVTRMARHLSDD